MERDRINSPAYGRVRNRLRQLKQSLRDPDSLEVMRILGTADGKDVCILYRARNGFGALDVAGVRIRDGETHRITSPADWEKQCAGMISWNFVGTRFL